MNIISINDVYEDKIKVNEIIIIRGWVKNKRISKLGFLFLDIYDGSTCNPIQFIVNDNLFNYQEISQLTVGCSIISEGKLVFSKGKNQKYEVFTKKIEVIGLVDHPNTYPISNKKHTLEYLRTMTHLRSRTNLIGVISRIRHCIFNSIHCFLDKKKYYWIPTPIITGIDTEGRGAMFRLSTFDFNKIPKNKDGFVDFKKDFFGKESFLTVSGQLTLEAYACSLSKVYTFGPTFRAENSNTSRHLAEFWMLEIEKSFSNLDDIILLAESLLKYLVDIILKNCSHEINFLNQHVNNQIKGKLEKFLVTDFININYIDAIDILLNAKEKFQEKVFFGVDLFSEHEKYIISYFNNAPVIIKNYPKELKSFYMRLNNDNSTVAAVDILLPGVGEIIGGSEREERIVFLKNRLKELGLKHEDYWWYLDLRRYGTVPHSGFGLGFERLISYITGVSNVRDLIPFPRTVKNFQF